MDYFGEAYTLCEEFDPLKLMTLNCPFHVQLIHQLYVTVNFGTDYALWGPRLTSRESSCSVIPEINAHRTQILNKESYIQVPIITTRDRRVKFTRQSLRPNHTNTLIAENIGLSGCPCHQAYTDKHSDLEAS